MIGGWPMIGSPRLAMSATCLPRQCNAARALPCTPGIASLAQGQRPHWSRCWPLSMWPRYNERQRLDQPRASTSPLERHDSTTHTCEPRLPSGAWGRRRCTSSPASAADCARRAGARPASQQWLRGCPPWQSVRTACDADHLVCAGCERMASTWDAARAAYQLLHPAGGVLRGGIGHPGHGNDCSGWSGEPGRDRRGRRPRMRQPHLPLPWVEYVPGARPHRGRRTGREARSSSSSPAERSGAAEHTPPWHSLS